MLVVKSTKINIQYNTHHLDIALKNSEQGERLQPQFLRKGRNNEEKNFHFQVKSLLCMLKLDLIFVF